MTPILICCYRRIRSKESQGRCNTGCVKSIKVSIFNGTYCLFQAYGKYLPLTTNVSNFLSRTRSKLYISLELFGLDESTNLTGSVGNAIEAPRSVHTPLPNKMTSLWSDILLHRIYVAELDVILLEVESQRRSRFSFVISMQQEQQLYYF